MLTQVSTRYGTYNIVPPEDLLEYIPEFLSNREKDRDALRDALSRKDFVELFRLGHRIKGVCQPFGFEVLGRIAEDLEASAHREDASQCESLIAEFERIVQSVKGAFPAPGAESRPLM